jgi:hypothetical protein
MVRAIQPSLQRREDGNVQARTIAAVLRLSVVCAGAVARRLAL